MSANRAYVAPEMLYYSNAVSPERLLLIEVLKSAVRDAICRGKRRDAHHRRNALCWLNSEDDKGEVHFTFVEICQELSLEPVDTRRRILAAIESGAADGAFDKRISATSPRKMERRRVEPRHKEHTPLSDLTEIRLFPTSAKETRHRLAFEANRVFAEKNR